MTLLLMLLILPKLRLRPGLEEADTGTQKLAMLLQTEAKEVKISVTNQSTINAGLKQSHKRHPASGRIFRLNLLPRT